MSDVLLGALIALVGVSVGTVGQVYTAGRTFRGEKRWAIAQQKREHVERLWIALEEIGDAYRINQSASLVYIASPSPVTLEAYSRNKKEIRWAEAEMLANLYMPSIADDLRALHMAGLEGSHAMLDETQKTLDGKGNGKEASDRLNVHSAKLITLTVKIRQQLLAESKDLEDARNQLTK